MTTGKNISFQGGLQIIKVKKGTTLPTIVKTNIEHANHVLKA